MKPAAWFVLAFLALPSVITITACGGGGSSSASASAAITVSVSQATAIVQAGQTLLISGTANNDPSGQGVKWSISPTSGAGTLSNANNNDVTYNAPATPPASDLTLTVTATSVADTTKSASVTITLPSVTVSVTAPASSVIAGGTVPNIVAIVGHDPSNKGVTWNVSCSPGPCGS